MPTISNSLFYEKLQIIKTKYNEIWTEYWPTLESIDSAFFDIKNS